MKLCLLALPLAVACSDGRHIPLGQRQESAVRSLGLKDPYSTGPVIIGCSDDSFLNSEGFRAIGPDGRAVEGSVCCGWLKGCTVRFK